MQLAGLQARIVVTANRRHANREQRTEHSIVLVLSSSYVCPVLSYQANYLLSVCLLSLHIIYMPYSQQHNKGPKGSLTGLHKHLAHEVHVLIR